LNKQILNPNWSSYNASGDCKKKAKDDITVETQNPKDVIGNARISNESVEGVPKTGKIDQNGFHEKQLYN